MHTEMAQYEFTLILTTDPSEEVADKLYGTFNDGTISTIAGLPQIHFHRESASLEEAIRSSIADVRAAGLDVERVDMQLDGLLHRRAKLGDATRPLKSVETAHVRKIRVYQ